MKSKNKLMVCLLGLIIIGGLGFYFYSIDNNLFVRDYDDYVQNPDCEFKELENGYTQLPSCARYKLKERLD